MKAQLFKTALIGLASCAAVVFAADTHKAQAAHAQHVIIYVWDGLRPDSVTPETTPVLYKLMKSGVQFSDNHSSYPTFTMMNAASFATGDRAGKTGFFGNTLWHPGIKGNDSANKPVDFNQPVFTEDYKILADLNKEELFYVDSLFNAAHQKKFTTAAVGKSGPAFMQDYLAQGVTLDEKHVYPLSFAKQLQDAGYSLPKLSPNDFAAGELTLKSDNGAPTDPDTVQKLADTVTPDASDQHGSPYSRANEYMANIFLKEIISKNMPQLSVLWMRNPDTTEHNYGPGSFNYRDALKSNDQILGQLLATLKEKKLDSSTDIIIVSDHAHSTVSGPLNLFPLRAIKDHQIGAVDSKGYSVSGEVRSAELLAQAGFHAFDGFDCIYNPVLSGIKSDNKTLYTTQIDKDGSVCGKADAKYITPPRRVPKDLPADAVIVAANGGSDYFYVPSHDKKLVEKVVKFLASHKQYDSIFVDGARYGKIDGTIPLATVGIENPQGRSPDIIVGFAYDATAKVNGLPGIEFSDGSNTRGMHGSFSPIDVHNFLMAFGPDFRAKFKDTLPSANVDVAPTVAYLLGLDLPNTDGRVLFESLVKEKNKSYQVHPISIQADKPLKQLNTVDAVNQATHEKSFTTVVYAKVLSQDDKKYYYFDRAKGVRK